MFNLQFLDEYEEDDEVILAAKPSVGGSDLTPPAEYAQNSSSWLINTRPLKRNGTCFSQGETQSCEQVGKPGRPSGNGHALR
ncbi:hypothetical protein DP115_32000 [Brasilonema octagenarum UFV-OR1]|nr:hypothetical protein [Brasilonema octagenarum UFV-OR1]